MPLLSNSNPYDVEGYQASYNTGRLKGGLKFSIAKLIVVIIVLGLLGGGGYYGYTYMKQKDNRTVNALGKEYVSYVVKGEYDKAYTLSAKNITESRTVQQFESSMSALKTPLPYFGKPQDVVFKDDQAYFYVKVDNLPPTTSGRTDGIFALTLVNDKGWKVSNLSVQ